MFKIAAADLNEARGVLKRIYDENPKHWPYGLDAETFDGGLYLIREKRSNAIVGFTGWQERREFGKKHIKSGALDGHIYCPIKVGYYSIGILPEFRNCRFAKEAVAKIIEVKSANVDEVKALIVRGNEPSMALARSLNVNVLEKSAAASLIKPEMLPGLSRLHRMTTTQVR